jgi:hypothetical protein
VKKHVVVIGAALVAATSALLAAGQSAGAPKAQPKVQNVSQRAAAIKRLPDGTPDIRGTWVRVGGGMNEANAPYSRQLHITERFTVTSDKLITFVMTYDDPKTFTRPVKVAGYLYPQDENEELTPEFTCHEGSYSMQDIFGF